MSVFEIWPPSVFVLGAGSLIVSAIFGLESACWLWVGWILSYIGVKLDTY